MIHHITQDLNRKYVFCDRPKQQIQLDPNFVKVGHLNLALLIEDQLGYGDEDPDRIKSVHGRTGAGRQ